ncbi:hypothetical protein IWQ55_006396 [Labrenzia sp. EL_208]|nr:hypothetical protein [Labrenzia sp. EL_132]MBG6233161.1 hypothetical protein [Labrenzia sp. EL_208]
MNGTFHGRVSRRGTRFGRGVLFGGEGISVPIAPTNILLSASSFSEDTALGPIAIITANGNPASSFTITNDPDGLFSIVSGVLNLIAPFDFETKTSHTVTIHATNSVGDPYEEEFTITVNDVVEPLAPTDIGISAATVREDALSGSIVATISSDGTGPVTYSKVSGSSLLEIVGTQIRTTGALSFPATLAIEIRAENAVGFVVESFNITVTEFVAADYTIASVADWNLVFANSDATLSNKSINVTAPDLPPLVLSNRTFTNLTMTFAGSSAIAKLDLDNVSGLEMDGLRVLNDNSAGADWEPNNTSCALVAENCTDVVVRNFFIDCDPPNNDGSQQSVARMNKRFGGFRGSWNDGVHFINGQVYRVRDAFVANDSLNTLFDGVAVSQFFEDGFTGGRTDWLIQNCTGTLGEGVNARRYLGTITGTITVGMLLDNGLTGAAKKIILVDTVDPGNTFIEGNYNNYAIPQAGETYSDGSGNQIQITSVASAVVRDGIHGDFVQGLLIGAVRDHQVIILNSHYVRSTPHEMDTLGQEQNVQWGLFQPNGSAFYHSPFIVKGCSSNGGQPGGLTAIQCGDGEIAFNDFMRAEREAGGHDINLANCRNLNVTRNVGDNNDGGPIDDDGGHTNVNLYDNTYVSRPDYVSEYVSDPYSYPQSAATFRPAVGSRIDQDGSGPYDTDGSLRDLTVPPYVPPTTPLLVEAAPAYVASAGSNTLSLGTFTAGAGANLKVIVPGHVFDSDTGVTTVSADWGGVAGELVLLQATGANFESIFAFQWLEADFPTDATGEIVLTTNDAASNLAAGVFTAANVKQSALAAMPAPVAANTNTLSITPPVAGCLVLAIASDSVGTTGLTFDEGASPYGGPYVFGSTATLLAGQATQGNSALTITHSITIGRPQIAAFALEPVPTP